MEVEKIDRINALAHKAKSVGLTEEEKNKLIDKQRKKCVLLRSKIVIKGENIIICLLQSVVVARG